MKRLIAKLFVIVCAIVLGVVALFWEPLFRSEFRILAITYSFKRPIFLSGQVFRMRNQDYRNFKYSVSVKGVPDIAARQMLLKEWQPFIDSGWLMVRFDENKTQFSNFLDTVRDVNLDDFDYVCKIDDDDWYAPDYFKTLNKEMQQYPYLSISSTRNAMILTENMQTTIFRRNNTELSGPSMCYHVNVVKVLLEIEKNPDNTKKYLSNVGDGTIFFDINEDAFIHRIGRALGPALERTSDPWKLIFGWQYRSVMRGGYVDTSDMKR